MSLLLNSALGEPAIPDSVVSQFDATETDSLLSSGSPVSDGGTIDEWLDNRDTGNDVTGGSPTRQDGVQNGETVVRFDGTDDSLSRDAANVTTVQQPLTIIAVVVNAAQNTTNNEAIFARASSDDAQAVLRWSSDGNWSLTGNAREIVGSNTATPIVLSGIYNGTDTRLRENGTLTGTTTDDFSTEQIESIELGATFGNWWLDGDIGEVLIYDDDLGATGDLSSEEQRLADKWGIAI